MKREDLKIVYAIILQLLVINILIYTGYQKIPHYHLFRYLYLFPIIFAAFYFGLNGAVFACLIVGASFSPLIKISLARAFDYQSGELIVTLIFFSLTGGIMGVISEKRIRKKLRYIYLNQINDAFNQEKEDVKLSLKNAFNIILNSVQGKGGYLIWEKEEKITFLPSDFLKEVLPPSDEDSLSLLFLLSSQNKKMRILPLFTPQPQITLLIPLVSPPNLRGLIFISKGPYENFNYEEKLLLKSLTNQIEENLERILLFQEVKNWHKYLEEILRHLHWGTIIVDAQSRIIFHNHQAVNLLGLDPRKIDGNFYYEVLPEKIKKILSDFITKSENKDELTTTPELIYHHIDTELNIPLGLRIINIEYNDAPSFVLFMEDLSLRKRLEKLRSLDKLKSHFISYIQEDLMIPLKAIKEDITSLLNNSSSNTKPYYYKIRQNCEYLIYMINNLLELSRQEAGISSSLNLRKIKIEKFLEKIKIVSFNFSLFKNSELEVKLPHPNHQGNIFLGDEDKLIQIFSNLIKLIVNSGSGEKIVLEINSTSYEEIEFRIIVYLKEGRMKSLKEIFSLSSPTSLKIDTLTKLSEVELYLTKHLITVYGGRIKIETKSLDKMEILITIPNLVER